MLHSSLNRVFGVLAQVIAASVTTNEASQLKAQIQKLKVCVVLGDKLSAIDCVLSSSVVCQDIACATSIR